MTDHSFSSFPSPAKPLMNEEIQYLSLMLELIGQQNWEAFGYAIVKSPTLFQSFSRTIAESDELNGMTILHACVRFNPPHQIVKMLIDLNPESPRRTDCLKRTPLHIAAGTRASRKVIELLAKAHPEACAIQDEDGKTPLHLACDSACELFDDEGNSSEYGSSIISRDPPTYEVIRALIKACPLCVALEDNDDMSALEHAIFSDAPIRVVKLLQYATKRQCEQEEQKRRMKRARRASEDSHERERSLHKDVMPSVVSFRVESSDKDQDQEESRSRSDDVVTAVPCASIPVTKEAFSSRRTGGGRVAKRNIKHAASA